MARLDGVSRMPRDPGLELAEIHAKEAPDRVRELEAWGAVFDRTLGIHPTGAEEFVTMREVLRVVEGVAS